MSILFFGISAYFFVTAFVFGMVAGVASDIKMVDLISGPPTGFGQHCIASGVFAIAGALS